MPFWDLFDRVAARSGNATVLRALTRAMQNDDHLVRMRAAEVAAYLAGGRLIQSERFSEAEKSDLVASVGWALHDEDPRVRANALGAFVDSGVRLSALPYAVSGLDDGDTEVRRIALLLLAEIGPEASAVSPKIVGQLSSDEPRVCQIAAVALTQVDPEEARLVLPRLRGHSNERVRQVVHQLLEELDSPGDRGLGGGSP